MTVTQLRKILKGLPPDMVVLFDDQGDLIELCARNVTFTEIEDADTQEIAEAIVFGECICDPEPIEIPLVPDNNPNLN